jgi:hypothetical protein
LFDFMNNLELEYCELELSFLNLNIV